MNLVPLDAERALLAAWMTGDDAWDLSGDLYLPGMFGGPWHNLIAERVVGLLQRGKPVDPVTVAAGIPRGDDEETDPTTYVVGLYSSIGSGSSARSYAEIVRAAWALRETRRALADGLEAKGVSAEKLIEDTQRRLSAIEVGDTGEIRTMEQDAMEWLEGLEAERDSKPGTEVRATGFRVVDQITGGLETGLPHLMAARPGGGKSAYAIGVARTAAGVLREPTALIWIEDTRQKALLRIAAAEAGIPAVLLRHGKSVPADAWERVMVAMDRVAKWPLYIEPAKGLTPRQVAARMRRLAREKGVRRFLCDHLGEMNLGQTERQVTQALGDALRTYRDTLEALSAGGIMFHQLSREAEAGGSPSIRWLYNSDQIGQVARVVGFLSPEARTMKVYFAKCTYGPPGTVVELGWDPSTMSVFQPEDPR
jgi:replicative DNA helicase